MSFYELAQPEGMPVDSAIAYLQETHGRVINAGFMDFVRGPKDTIWLELKRGEQDFSIIQAALQKRGYPIVTGAMNKPIGVSFLNGEWKVSVSAKPGHNRSKFTKIDKSEFEQEFAGEIAAKGMRISVGRSKNLFFVIFNGRSLPDDFRQRLGVVGRCTVSKATPANYYYGPKQEVTLP